MKINAEVIVILYMTYIFNLKNTWSNSILIDKGRLRKRIAFHFYIS